MPRRKQDCPKRMKWEGGEDGEEGDKLEGDDDSGGSMSPNSASSQIGDDEEATSPTPGDLPATPSPRSVNEDLQNSRELSNSRCQSRESSEPRCPSGESMLSMRAVPIPGTGLSPVGVTLPATLPAAAAAALLPPQTAAMAAYLNAAAAAVQQSHRLMMASPPSYNRAPISPCSPPNALQHSPPCDNILDFSKRAKSDDSDSDAVNLSKSVSPPPPGNGPLDLSVSSRKRIADELVSQPPNRKPRTDFKPQALPQWSSSHLPYFAAAVAAASTLSPPKANNQSSDLWNGKLKGPATCDATKALEKMSELSKLGGDDLFRMAGTSPGTQSSNRHSAWQSHWLNKGAEQAKDVLKCVWCKQSFPSLAAMTTHMKEAKHCGVNVPVPPMQPQMMQPQPQITSPTNTNTSTSSTNSNKPSDINMLIKETMPLPRKLVRGQDVWLGKGAEQTRQILKCMWCGQSFRSLAEMTSHMQQTQHYTNIISQEQIISWRSSEDSKGGGPGGPSSGGSQPPGGTSSHVSAVLTCKVCDQAFTSLKELSNHMVKNSHYKEHIMRSITESGGRRRQTREKRKKSLPVRKLLELERAQHEFKNGDSTLIEKMRDTSSARITCEKCGNKIETTLFVDHIRQCIGASTIPGSNQRNFLKSALTNTILPPESPKGETIKTRKDKTPSPQGVTDLSTNKESGGTATENNNGSSPSVLNAIEKLIEKSFDSRARQNASFSGHANASAPMGSSILKRLGIDESVDYTKPLVDAHTMNLLRNYHHHQYGRRERSGSESSSISERGSNRVDSVTPERKMEPPSIPTPRSTPDKKDKELTDKHCDQHEFPVKREPEENHVVKMEDRDDDEVSYHSNDVKEEDEEKRKSPSRSPVQNPESSPCRNSASPASSDRSATPRSTNGENKKNTSSLGALSSMFDSLSGNSINNEASSSSGKKGPSHPLAALQKLCDKTEKHNNNRAHSSGTSTAVPAATSTPIPTTTPGAILAFSWACNDAVMTSDSIMKCAFCDTPFISKGAYRHHLSKMHFVKDGVIPDPVAVKQNNSSASSEGVPLKSTAVPASTGPGSTGSKSPPVGGSFEESPHSKFLKYTELAKQLSSKYV